MDSLITAAARALAAGHPLGALKLVALRDDAPALALRGIAMAQLGELVRAKALLRSAARAFGPREAVAKARCLVAEVEIALASRDLGWNAEALDAARVTLEEHGDRVNAAHARYLEVRRMLLIGRLDEAERALTLVSAPLPPALMAAHELVVAGIAMRRLRTKAARAALARAEVAARAARIPALMAEVESALLILETPAARLIASGDERLLLLEEVEALFASKAFVVDACRHVVRHESKVISLAKRPVLLTLARVLAEAWPGDVPRDTLVARAFRLKLADESHRARLRVEMGRLRKVAVSPCRRECNEGRVQADAAPHSRSRRARAACRGKICGRARPSCGWGIVVELGLESYVGDGPTQRAARARFARGRRQGAVIRPRSSPPLADPARARIRDDFVTPRCAAH